MPDARVTLRRKSPYCTRSNKFKKVRTPGGKLTIQYTKKLASAPICGDTGRPLYGVAVVRPKERKRLPKRRLTVTRCYGGVLSAYAVRNRIIRAFLLEEQKIVKKVLKQQKEQKQQQQKEQLQKQQQKQQQQQQKQQKKAQKAQKAPKKKK